MLPLVLRSLHDGLPCFSLADTRGDFSCQRLHGLPNPLNATS